MPSLIETFIDYEPDQLNMIAEQWGIEQDLDPAKSQAKQLAILLGDEILAEEVMQALPQAAINALVRLTRSEGKMPLDQFEREFGELREMGAARREKVRPDRNPDSTSELLYYKGIIARAFFKADSDHREFIYIPDELYQFLEKEIARQNTASVPVLPGYDAQRIFQANDAILDHTCTLLAASRNGMPISQLTLENPEIPVDFLLALLTEIGLVDSKDQANPQAIGTFLETRRAQSFSSLVHTWRTSNHIHETQLLETLEFEGSIKLQPLKNREKLLSILQSLPDTHWLDIGEFCEWMKTYQPDFMRTSGEFDSWIIRDKQTDQYIKGFEHWDRVEGALLRRMLLGPCYWLGLVDLGTRTKASQPDLFRPSKWAQDLLAGKAIDYPSREASSFIINKDGSILIQHTFPLSMRYQIARFCDWLPSERMTLRQAQGSFSQKKKGKYAYQISHPALQRALQQGLQVNQLITLINKYGQKPLPPNISKALERWKQNELEAVFEQAILLRVRSAAILDQVMNSRAKDFIIARLNETSAVVKTSAVNQLKNALLDAGILADVKLEV